MAGPVQLQSLVNIRKHHLIVQTLSPIVFSTDLSGCLARMVPGAAAQHHSKQAQDRHRQKAQARVCPLLSPIFHSRHAFHHVPFSLRCNRVARSPARHFGPVQPWTISGVAQSPRHHRLNYTGPSHHCQALPWISCLRFRISGRSTGGRRLDRGLHIRDVHCVHAVHAGLPKIAFPTRRGQGTIRAPGTGPGRCVGCGVWFWLPRSRL